MTGGLFDRVQLGGCSLRNRIVMAPMSQHAAGEERHAPPVARGRFGNPRIDQQTRDAASVAFGMTIGFAVQ